MRAMICPRCCLPSRACFHRYDVLLFMMKIFCHRTYILRASTYVYAIVTLLLPVICHPLPPDRAAQPIAQPEVVYDARYCAAGIFMAIPFLLRCAL